MGAMVKNLAPELIRSSTEPGPISVLCLDNNLARMRIVDLNNVEQRSKFLTLVILIPRTEIQGEAVFGKTSAKTIKRHLEKSTLLPHFSKTMQQATSTVPEGQFVFGDAAVNFSAMEAWRSGEPVALTAMEFKILMYMIRNERRAISRDELLNEVWGYENYPCTRTVDNHILRLRQKFEREPSRPVHFRTVHGFGYKFLSHRVQV